MPKVKPGIIIALFVIAIGALIAFSTLNGPRYRVEVCVFFGGRFNCKKVSGHSESAALRGGIQNACADIASGVNETMSCEGARAQKCEVARTTHEVKSNRTFILGFANPSKVGRQLV